MSDVDTLPAPEDEPGVTPWFVNGETPARPGVYQRDIREGAGLIRYARWTGHCWRRSASTPELATTTPLLSVSSIRYVLPWRGLTYNEYAERMGMTALGPSS